MTLSTKRRAHGTTYYVRTTWQGRRYDEHAGHDRREAERLDARRQREVRDGTYQPPELRRGGTVGEFGARWLAARATRSADNDRALLERHVLSRPWFAALRLDELRPRHCVQLVGELSASVSERTGRRLSPKTVAICWSILRTMVRDARIAELIDVDPCVLPRGLISKRPATRRTAYDVAEVRRLLAVADPQERALTSLALWTGCRAGELCGLTWGDYDAGTRPLGALSVQRQYDGQPLKTDRPRVVPVHPALADELQAWRSTWTLIQCREPTAADPILPTAAGTHRHRSSAYKLWRACCRSAGVANRSLHSTRHTMITLARRGGARQEVVERITHNAAGTVVDGYTHWDWLPLCHAIACVGVSVGARADLAAGWLQLLDSNRGARGKGRESTGNPEKPAQADSGPIAAESVAWPPNVPRDHGPANNCRAWWLAGLDLGLALGRAAA